MKYIIHKEYFPKNSKYHFVVKNIYSVSAKDLKITSLFVREKNYRHEYSMIKIETFYLE